MSVDTSVDKGADTKLLAWLGGKFFMRSRQIGGSFDYALFQLFIDPLKILIQRRDLCVHRQYFFVLRCHFFIHSL